MKLVQNAHKWYKMASNLAFGAIAALTAAQAEWGGVVSSLLPEELYYPAIIGLAILGIPLRLIDQGLDK